MPFPDTSMQHRFRNAVEALATRPGSLQERLRFAFGNYSSRFAWRTSATD